MNTTEGYCECGCGELAPTATKTASARGYVTGEPFRFIKGHNALGATWTDEQRKRFSEKTSGENHWLSGKDITQHPRWSGDEVGYSALHRWVAKGKDKTGVCSHCKLAHDTTDWANVSGEYRRDLDDFIELCRSCHRHFDYSRGREMVYAGS